VRGERPRPPLVGALDWFDSSASDGEDVVLELCQRCS
jgi:hypothetical protein